MDDTVGTSTPTCADRVPFTMHGHGWILPDQLLASGRDMSLAHPPHPELVLLCGGTEQQRASLRRAHSAAIDSRTAVTTRDVHSLLRWAPRSRAVIVCGELAGIGVATLERLVRDRAPGVPVIGGDMPLNGNGKPANGRAAVSNGASPISTGHLAFA